MGIFSNIFSFRKKDRFIAPMAGKVMALKDIPDPVFSEGILGEGFAIELSAGKVVAPFDCEVISCFPTGHAYGLKSTDGTEILLHIGIDTVELNGQGFDKKVKMGQIIKQGDILAIINLESIVKAGKSLISPLVFLNGKKCTILKVGSDVELEEKDIVVY